MSVRGSSSDSIALMSVGDGGLQHQLHILHEEEDAIAATTSGEELLLSHDQSQQQRLHHFRTLVGREKEERILQNAISRLFKDDPICLSSDKSTSNATATTTTSSNANAISPTTTTNSTRTMALISGASGSGKSALAMHCRKYCSLSHGQKKKYLFVAGKFDLHHIKEPYSGIKMAMEGLCEQIQQQQQQQQHEQHEDLQTILPQELTETELQLLYQLIPNLSSVIRAATTAESQDPKLHQFSSTNSTTMAQTRNYQELSDRLRFVLGRFMQIICNHCPLIIVIDDIQWADQASLNLIQSWMHDGTIKSLMIIGCCRTGSTNSSTGGSSIGSIPDDEEAPHMKMMKSLELSKRERSICILRMHIEHLQLEHIQELLADVLFVPGEEEDTEKIAGLADIVYQKTGGNPFHIQEYVQLLKEDNLLTFDDANMKWEWTNESIAEKSSVTTKSVQNLTMQKLQKLEVIQQATLLVAACFGSIFVGSLVQTIIRAMSIHSDHSTFFKEVFGIRTIISDSDIRGAVLKCHQEGLTELCSPIHGSDGAYHSSDEASASSQVKKGRSSKGKYKFTHDKIQEASLALIPPHKLSELRFRVGEILLSALSSKKLESKLFAVANLINSRLDLLPSDGKRGGSRCAKIAALNHKAGLQAVGCSALPQAMSYFKYAIELLPDDHWKVHFEQSLDIYSSAAECAFAVHEIGPMRKYCSEIISLDCDILYKIRAHHVLIEASIAEAEKSKDSDQQNTDTPICDKVVDCVDLCVHLLEALGVKQFPKSRFGRSLATLGSMVQMRRMTSKWTDTSLQSVPISKGATDHVISKTFNMLSIAAYLTKPDLIPLITYRRVSHALKRGITTYSPIAFVFQAFIVSFFMGDFQAGKKMGRSALKMLEMSDDKIAVSNTTFSLHAIVWHWTNPLEESIDGLQEAYLAGMSSGNATFAMWSLLTSTSFCLVAGKPLQHLDSQIVIYSQLMCDFRQNGPHLLLQIAWQGIHNLMGNSAHSTLLVGDAFDERKFLQKTKEGNGSDPMPSMALFFNKVMIATHFGEYENGATIILDHFDEIMAKLAGMANLPEACLTGGLCCYVNAKKSKKNFKMAKRCRAKLKEWAKKGNPNCIHGLAILNAEHAVRERRFDAAINYYDQAIKECGSRQFIHSEALANERCAMCLLQKNAGQAGENKAREYFEESIRLYDEWGAHKKVELQRYFMAETWGVD